MLGFPSLETIAHWAAILTAFVAAFGYGRFTWERHRKRRKLEDYLKAEGATGDDRGQRTVLHFVAALGMTEADVMDTAFRSKKIQRRTGVDKNGRADTLLFEYRNKKKVREFSR